MRAEAVAEGAKWGGVDRDPLAESSTGRKKGEYVVGDGVCVGKEVARGDEGDSLKVSHNADPRARTSAWRPSRRIVEYNTNNSRKGMKGKCNHSRN